MMEPLVLSIDCGTQSLRAILFTKDGEIEALEKTAFEQPYFSSKAGWAEQQADVYYRALCATVNRLRESAGDRFARVAAVAVTTQRDTSVFLDGDGKPVRPCILWLDQREADLRMSDSFPKAVTAACACAGALPTCEHAMRRARAHWVRKNEPEVWVRTHKVVLLSCYLNFLLTGHLADSSASQIGYIPFDVKRADWRKKGSLYYRLFGVSRGQMPQLVRPGGTLGKITAIASAQTGIPEGLPVIAAASDKGCETLGNGCLSEDTASISFGTTATAEVTTAKYVEVHPLIPPFPCAIDGFYNPEYEVYRGYWLISWFKKEFAAHEVQEARRTGRHAEDLLNRELSGVPAGAGGLMIQPYWTPELMAKDGRGAIIGFNDTHTRLHIYRAIIEGINFALMDGLQRIEERTKTPIARVVVAGGGSQSGEICQIAADMFGRPVHRVQTHETSGLGAAILGFTGIGQFPTVQDAVKAMVRHRDVFSPDLRKNAVYRRLYTQVYKNMFPALKNIYKTSRRILEEAE